MTTTNSAPDQTSTQTQPTADPMLAVLQAQQAQMDAKLKIQQDQQALLAGALPASTATPNSGAFTVTGANPFPSQRLAYMELQEVARKIADKVNAKEPIIVYDQTEINSLVNYKAMIKMLTNLQTQVQGLQTEFDDNLHPAAQELLTLPQTPISAKALAGILAPGLALAGLKTVSDLIGMFRTNTTIAYSNFTADDAALTAAVLEHLNMAGKTVYQPALVPVQVIDDTSAFMDQLLAVQSALAKMLDQAGQDQAKLQQISDALGGYLQADQASQSNHDLIAAETDAAKRTALQTKQVGLDRMRDVTQQYALRLFGAAATSKMDVTTANILKAARDQFLKVLAGFVVSIAATATAFGTLQTALSTVTNTGSVTLTAILRAEKLMTIAKQTDVRILLVKTSVLGGSIVARTNSFTGGHLLFTGGAIANFTLFDATGAVKSSGVVVGESRKQEERY
ncbi:MAG TPA: hypothetical protein VGK22_08505 [Candidatus Angelobacter sp.]|jgi:hypothetical protein